MLVAEPHTETGKSCSKHRTGIIIVEGQAVLQTSVMKVTTHQAFPRKIMAHLCCSLLWQWTFTHTSNLSDMGISLGLHKG